MNNFIRTEILIGKENLDKLKNARVLVAGIGGVGSYCVEALARAAVGHMLLIDNDTVCESNINRQIHADTQTIGQFKTHLMKERVLKINPSAEIITEERFILPENIESLNPLGYDYIVDAIDTISAKIALAELADRHGIKIISAMSAGNKLDPTKFIADDLYNTSVCPICKVMRYELKKRGILKHRVVYSTEKPIKPSGSPEVMSKRAPLGSISFVPSVMGLILAGEVIRGLIS